MHTTSADNSFKELLLARILGNISNSFTDNNRDYIFRKNNDRALLDRDCFLSLDYPDFDGIINKVNEVAKTNEYLYSRLSDEQSKDCLLTLSSYLCLGHRHVRLPAWHPHIASRLKQLIRSCSVQKNGIKYKDFHSVGIPIFCNTNNEILYSYSYDTPYTYKQGLVDIDVKIGDIVLDCGVGSGLTSLVFAAKCGNSGKVLAIEPVERALSSAQSNFNLNPDLITIIDVIPFAVFNVDDKILLFSYNNRSTALINNSGNQSATTKTIDTIIQDNNYPHVDFIKMDIEGSELQALQGANETLKRFKPKLAISIYHQNEKLQYNDYLHIPKFIDSLNLNYSFYIKHHGFNRTETILYATTML